MSSTAASKGGEWSKEDLEAKPEEPEQEIHPLDAEKWTTVYKFKYVKVLRIIVRLKIYQSVVGLATFVALPINQYFGWPLSDGTWIAYVLNSQMIYPCTFRVHLLMITDWRRHFQRR